ncbi:MAG: hypothetical protein IMZ47_06505 [Firmicutes bacterium]|nr:hypothetical protein [Bacillota bacterium]
MEELLEKLKIVETQMEYKFFSFRLIAEKSKTKVWGCFSKHGDKLGEVQWFASWRRYCYFPEKATIYSVGCLTDIADFVTRVQAEHNG